MQIPVRINNFRSSVQSDPDDLRAMSVKFRLTLSLTLNDVAKEQFSLSGGLLTNMHLRANQSLRRTQPEHKHASGLSGKYGCAASDSTGPPRHVRIQARHGYGPPRPTSPITQAVRSHWNTPLPYEFRGAPGADFAQPEWARHAAKYEFMATSLRSRMFRPVTFIQKGF